MKMNENKQMEDVKLQITNDSNDINDQLVQNQEIREDTIQSLSNVQDLDLNSTPHPMKQIILKNKRCTNCQKDLMRNIRITCVECIDKNTNSSRVELCIECFAGGFELGEHKKDHQYTVSDCLAYPLIQDPSLQTSNEWTAEEELLLLDGIEMFGMGNWKDIAEHIGTKTEKKCEMHYMGAYLSTSNLLPVIQTQQDREKESLKNNEDSKEAMINHMEVDTNGTEESKNNATSVRLSVSSVGDPSVNAGSIPSVPSGPSAGNTLNGYMPLRGDFDVEFDNDAELILADMEFSEEDSATERELKLKVIEIYNTKLDERERRKKFVIDYGLLDYKQRQQMERRRPKEEREIVAQMRPFARFHSPKEHEEFVNGLITAMHLQKQIALLQEYRKNGVRTLAEAELYNVEKKKREADLASQKRRDEVSYLYPTAGRPTSTGKDRANRLLNRDKSFEGSQDISSQNAKKGSSPDNGANNGSSTPSDKPSEPTFVIDGTPGCHLLTPDEKEICSRLKLLPKHYLVIKDALVRECYRLGYLTKQNASNIVKIEEEKTDEIHEFFVNCGWIRTNQPASKDSTSPLKTLDEKKTEDSSAEGSSTTTPNKQNVRDIRSGRTTPSKRKADKMSS